MITIEIHGARADGTPYRLNAFNEEKVALGSPGADEKGWRKRYEAFLRRAERDALVWRRCFRTTRSASWRSTLREMRCADREERARPRGGARKQRRVSRV